MATCRVVPSLSWRRAFFVAVFLAFAGVYSQAQTSGNALSKEKLIALKNAGLNDSVLIQQIQKDGISFDMNADTTLELKNAGFSNDVLQALLQTSTKVAPASAQPAQNDSVAALYKAGKFPELADHLKATLRGNPSDWRTHALLILTLLKMKDKDAAEAEFQALSTHEQDPAASPYVKQVKTLLDTLTKTQVAKDKLIAALKEYRSADAYEAVDELQASPVQKEILKVDLDVYQAKFDQAQGRFSKIQFASYAEKQRSTKIRDNIAETEAAYKKQMSRAETYFYSQWATMACHFPKNAANSSSPEWSSLTAKDYLEGINNLAQLSPLADDVMNLSFHAALLAGNYEQLEILGDRLLKTRGRIRIPFYASDRYFWVVIDAQKRHISTEPDPRPYQLAVAGRKWEDRFHYATDLVPFDLAFEQIQAISQRAGNWNDHLEKQAYVFRFEPTGVAPYYAVIQTLFCTAGEKAELTATRNLGQYVVHVISNKNIKAELADPAKTKGPSGGLDTAALILSGALAASGGNSALNQMAMQGLQAQQAQQMATYQAQQAAWESFAAARDTFNFVEADAFTGLEQLLGVLN